MLQWNLHLTTVVGSLKEAFHVFCHMLDQDWFNKEYPTTCRFIKCYTLWRVVTERVGWIKVKLTSTGERDWIYGTKRIGSNHMLRSCCAVFYCEPCITSVKLRLNSTRNWGKSKFKQMIRPTNKRVTQTSDTGARSKTGLRLPWISSFNK